MSTTRKGARAKSGAPADYLKKAYEMRGQEIERLRAEIERLRALIPDEVDEVQA